MAYAPAPLGSYWEWAVPGGRDDPQVQGIVQADVAIIGAGYTGLSAALHLARDFGCAPVVLEAQEVGWGASGRNGGFNCMGGGKLSDRAYVARFGVEDLERFGRAQVAAVDLVGALTDGVQVDRQPGGEWVIAHRDRDFEGFAAQAQWARRVQGLKCEILPAGALAGRGLRVSGGRGAMLNPAGFPLNPRRYVLALAEKASAAGARIHARSPVHAIERRGGRFRLHTPQGEVLADRIILAANGYNAEDVPGWMAGRYLPVISHIMVTDPCPQGDWQGTQMAYDSRNMLHYWRRLPDGRMLFGMRGAANDGPAARGAMKAAVRAHFDAMFPDYAGVPTAFHWAGLVCMSRGLLPYVGPMEQEGAWTALAYHGNGVSMGTWCGRQVAGMAMGREYGGLPDGFRGPLRRFPAAPFRRLALPAAFRWYGWQDR